MGVIHDFTLTPLNLSGGQYNSLADVFEADNPAEVADFLADPSARISLGKVTLLPPIDQQEVWAAGVTYRRSQTARMEESTVASSLLRPGLPFAAPGDLFQGDATPSGGAQPGDSHPQGLANGMCPNRS